MPNVMIRDVPAADLEQIRSAAADQGVSLQAYLRDAVHTQAAQLRRRVAVARTAERLRGRDAVPETERQAVLEAIDDAHAERAEQLTDRPAT
ncbi:antitoxin [Phytoactinopolyspora endophytica]|uniref:antitoxin n=1 Tax=Phytoactinopolyspora endophytica TaxID=1642495 RepID=UPI00101C298D|nr:antitoxin [Phytoactinopolyspora endophytica]